MKHDYEDLITIFNQLFAKDYNTQLLLGGDEPIYLPADETHSTHRIIFARGFFASALHEIAHWCVAGPKRRLIEDYGYWYEADGRDEATQKKFEIVETKPQAIEWILSASCNFPFQVSCDNLHGSFDPDRAGFREKVRQQVLIYLEQGLPPRVALLSQAFCSFYDKNKISTIDFSN